MSHLYFDLTMDDEHFPDPVGEIVTDLTAAHARAVLLVRRVMMFSESDAETPRAKRGVVTIKDDTGRVLLSVIVPCDVPVPSQSVPPSQSCSPELATRQIARSSRPPVVENSSSSQKITSRYLCSKAAMLISGIYRERAGECDQLAEKKPEERKRLEKVAETWRQLAKAAEDLSAAEKETPQLKRAASALFLLPKCRWLQLARGLG